MVAFSPDRVVTLGQFNTLGATTRAQMATVACTLMDRINGAETPTGAQTWTEGQSYSEPKDGDIVVKADGTKVTLKETFGVLGFG